MKLLTLSNYVPEQIVDLVRFVNYNGIFRQSHFCKYIQDFTAMVLEDDSINGAVIPSSCDSVRSAADLLAESGKFIYQLKHPLGLGKNDERSQIYFAQSIETYKENVASHFNITIDKDIVAERTVELRERGKYLRDVYIQSQGLCYSEYISQINIMLSHRLTDWKKYAPAPKNSILSGKRVYVIGPFLESVDMLCQIEKAGLQIVGDNLTNSKRLMWSDYVFEKDTIFTDIAAHILKYQVSPTVNRFAVTWEQDYAEIKSKNVQGVIFIHQKFCEPYNYLFTLYSHKLENEGIPIICVYTGNENVSVFEGFSEMI